MDAARCDRSVREIISTGVSPFRSGTELTRNGTIVLLVLQVK